VASTAGIQVVDVRTLGEHQGAHIKGSKLLSLSALEASLDRLEKAAPVLLYCASGGRSAVALELLQRHGFRQVSHLEGGLAAWIEAGLPVERATSRFPWS
jgi:rhodanese-related sulfurtransferase